MTIKPIETRWNGYRFRSRLEARWAVFFAEQRVRFVYEPEGYRLGELGAYLPDFFLPDFNLFIEVKGAKPAQVEIEKCRRLADLTNCGVWLVHGLPVENPGFLFGSDIKESGAGGSDTARAVIAFAGTKAAVASDRPGVDRYCFSRDLTHGYPAVYPLKTYVSAAARSARFEHGESPQRERPGVVFDG